MLEIFIRVKAKGKFQRKIYRIALFFWNLVIYSIPLNLIEYGIIKLPKIFLSAFANIIVSLLKISSISFKIEENIIIVDNFPFVISYECIGYKSLLGLFALIMATPLKEYKIRVKYFLIFAPFILLINIFRVYSTIILYHFLKIDPFLIHDALWAVLTTLTIIVFWIYFYYKNRKLLI